MTNLKRSIFWVALYLTLIVILAQFDYDDAPIIDFAKYFYFAVVVAVPATVFFPYTAKLSPATPLIFWGVIYFIIYRTFDRSASSPGNSLSIVALEFLVLWIGIWLAYQLAQGISHAEFVMDAMAIRAFPNRTMDIEEAGVLIKTEITRSRRYHRPLSLLVLQPVADDRVSIKELISTIQHDLWSRFSFARMGQIIDEYVRQTDIVLREHGNRFLILCPETDSKSLEILAERICQAVEIKTGIVVYWGVASFPNDALNFDDLLVVARGNLVHSKPSIDNNESLALPKEPEHESVD